MKSHVDNDLLAEQMIVEPMLVELNARSVTELPDASEAERAEWVVKMFLRELFGERKIYFDDADLIHRRGKVRC